VARSGTVRGRQAIGFAPQWYDSPLTFR